MRAVILRAQRTRGNKFVQRLLKAGVIRPKLTVSQPEDSYEQEADRVADAIMRMPDPKADGRAAHGEARRSYLQRKCSSCEEEDLQREAQDKGIPQSGERERLEVSPDVESGIKSLGGGGRPLADSLRAFFEPRFGHDFGHVRIHTGCEAAQLARAVNARAFTVGRDVVFGAGEYAPETTAGKRLLAHELTHVLQQAGGAAQRELRVEPEQQRAAGASGDRAVLHGPSRRSPAAKVGSLLAPRRIQRLTIHTPGAGLGLRAFADDDSFITITPSATYWVSGARSATVSFGAGQEATLTLRPGTAGVIQIGFAFHFEIDNSLPWTNIIYNRSAVASWSVRVSTDGDITIDEAGPVYFYGATEPTFQLYVGSIAATRGENLVDARVFVITTSSHGREGGIPGYVVTQGMAGRTWDPSFRLHLRAPRPAPRPSPGSTLYGTTASFDVGRDRFEEHTERHVVGWFAGLPTHVRRAIESGSAPIVLRGRASTTQPGPANRELSRRRAQRVQQILQDTAGSNAHFQIFALGEYQARTTGEASTERVVEIEVTVQNPAP